MNYKFNITEVELIDLNGADYRDEFLTQTNQSFDSIIGNLIYAQSSDIDLADKAKYIHKSREVILTEREKPMFVKIIEDSTYLPLIKREILSKIIPME